MEYIAFIIVFILLIPLVLFLILKPVIRDRKTRNNIMNSDTFSQHYCFELNCSQQEAISQLSIPNVMDKPEYTFDINSLIIAFSHNNCVVDHQLYFYTIENKTYLKVSRVNTFLFDRGIIPFMVNSFFINKIGATPVDYNYFETIVNATH